MPKKAKEQTEKEELKVKKAAVKKSATAKKAQVKKADSTAKKSSTARKTTLSKKTTTTKKAATASKVSITKKASTTNKSSTKKSATTKKITSEKKVTTNKATKKPTKKVIAKVQAVPVVEYYDLPYRYNQTIVKLLAQTPTTLFVYWDISDNDRENYKKTYGEHIFEETKPVLIIKNNTLSYSYEVEINDFANCWYIHVNDSKCDYSIDLGRRPISVEVKNKIETDYIYISSSNGIESPNDRILFNVNEQKVYYKNIKTNTYSTRKVSFINTMGKIYNIYELYKTIYKDEDFIDSADKLPTSSTSSWFK